MVVRLLISPEGTPDELVLETTGVDYSLVDLLCPNQRCSSRNDFGSFFCCDCGTKLLLKSKETTQSIATIPPCLEEEPINLMVELNPESAVHFSAYEDSAIPNEWYQRRIIEMCGHLLRRLVTKLNLLHYWCLTSPARPGSKMMDERFRVLSEIREMLVQFHALITKLIAEEFKAKI